MRIFYNGNTPSSWGSKVNFADNKNVLVGYDMGQSCCESFGWHLHSFGGELVANDSTPAAAMDAVNLRIASYEFDPDFCEVKDDDPENSRAKFKLYGPDGDILYLTLHNSHNGYYGHGFHVNIGGVQVKDGCL